MQKDSPILVFIFICSLISTFIHISLWGSFVCLVHSREAGLCSGAGVLLQESSCSTFPAPPKFYLALAIPTSTTASTPGGKGPCCLSCHSCQSLLRRWKGTFQRAPWPSLATDTSITTGREILVRLDCYARSQSWSEEAVEMITWGGRSLAAENHLSLLPALGTVDLDWEYKTATQHREKVFWNWADRFGRVILWCQPKNFENGGVFMDSRCLSIHNSWLAFYIMHHLFPAFYRLWLYVSCQPLLDMLIVEQNTLLFERQQKQHSPA